jgi:hypothetical protein
MQHTEEFYEYIVRILELFHLQLTKLINNSIIFTERTLLIINGYINTQLKLLFMTRCICKLPV